MRFLAFVFSVFFVSVAMADTTVPAPIGPRVSIFSTTVDWAAVSGIPLKQFVGTVKGRDKSLVKQGLVLYYLDAFPCYGEADSVRVWLSQNGKMSGHLRLVCLYKPDTISFAWRNADEQASEAVSTGILKCPVEGERNFTIDISKCERGKDWKEIR